ncbi:Rrf2 family transcriptional regulator [Patescibacteria group bacterium]|nr:Rrf2 family transcriptional regulator [Patescibacteria group bacterium]
MFQLRKETDYAIQFLKLLSKQKKESLSLAEISKTSGISFLFLQKIARKLRMAKIIKAEYGVRGGYSLRIPPEKISLKKIIEVVEGRCGLLACSGLGKAKCECSMGHCCDLRSKMDKVNAQILKVLEGVKLKDL